MHSDFIPFAWLAFVVVVIASLLVRKSFPLALVFLFGGIAPLLGAVSDSERWFPDQVELAAVYCGFPLLILGTIQARVQRIPSGWKAFPFWILATIAISLSAWVGFLTYGLSQL